MLSSSSAAAGTPILSSSTTLTSVSPRVHAPSPSHWALEELAPNAGSHVLHGASVAVATDDLESLVRDAFERGVTDGRRAGEAAEAARLQPVFAALNEALLALQVEADQWVGNAQENICALAIAIAQQVLDRQISLDPSAIAPLVHHALAEFPLDQAVVVRLHPADLPVVASMRATLRDSQLEATQHREIQWLPDARLSRGGCLIEGRDRIIDGRIDSALERLYRRLSQIDA